MSWHAVRAIREAGVTTRAFLLPADRGRWLRLAALSLLVGAGWLVPAIARLAVPDSVASRGVTDPLIAVTVGGLALTGPVADAYGRFALLSSLRSRRLRLTEDVRWRLGRATRWVVFGFGAGVLVAAAAGVALRALRAGWLALTSGDPVGVVGATVTASAGTLAVLVGVAVVGFAHATVSLLPAAMLATGVGALGSWRRLWGAFAGHRGGFVGYLLVRGLVAIAVMAAALLASGALVAGSAIVGFVVLVGVFGTVAEGIAVLGGAPAVAVAAVAVLAAAVLPVWAVTTTYLASYDLAVLGAVDPDLALLDAGAMDGPPENGAVSVVLPDGTRAGHADPETGVEETPPLDAGSPADDDTGAFQFGTVEEE